MDNASKMDEQQIYTALTEIFRDVLCSPHLTLTAETNAKEVDGWDSFAQVNIIVASESRFGVRIKSVEAQGLKNVGDLVRVIQRKWQ